MLRAFAAPQTTLATGPTGKEMMTFADWTPACDIQETPEAYVIHAEIPDVKKEDVKVTSPPDPTANTSIIGRCKPLECQ